MSPKIPHPLRSRHGGSPSKFDLDAELGDRFDLDAELEKRETADRKKRRKMDRLVTDVEGKRKKDTTRLVAKGPWPKLFSTYFVQAEGDISAFEKVLATRKKSGAPLGLGLATNVPNLQTSPKMHKLVLAALSQDFPVFIDSGAAKLSLDGPIDWLSVLRFYERVVDGTWNGTQVRHRIAADPARMLCVVAPDVIPGKLSGLTPGMAAARTRQLQDKYSVRLQDLAFRGVGVIYPIQAKDSRRFEEDADRIFRSHHGGGEVVNVMLGIPGRDPNDIPMFPLVRYLLRSPILGLPRYRPRYLALPRLHFLGVGSSRRLDTYMQFIRVAYRAIASGSFGYWFQNRMGLFAGMKGRITLDEAAWTLLNTSPAELQRLTSCTASREDFPCPPGWTQSLAGSHPKMNDALRWVWEEHPDQDFVTSGFDRLTSEVIGRDDVTVDWYGLVQKHHDWTEICLPVIEEAEATDPCMVPATWDMDDIEAMLGAGGLDRVQSDATTVNIAARNGIWIRNGQQSKATTPAWWKKRSREFRFLWNLRAMLWDRYMREQSLSWRTPTGYDDRGFTLGESPFPVEWDEHAIGKWVRAQKKR